MKIKDIIKLEINYLQDDKESVASKLECLLNTETQVYAKVRLSGQPAQVYLAHTVFGKLSIYTKQLESNTIVTLSVN